MTVFKAYDIRGRYPEQVNEDLYYKIGNSLHILGTKKAVIGYDMRESSESLTKSIIEGMRKAGIDVIDIGLSPTPKLYHASHDFDADTGLIITASHNPKDDNGIKICRHNAYPVAWEDGIEQIKDAVDNFEEKVAKKEGDYRKEDYNERYLSHLRPMLDCKKTLKVILDAGNGMGGHDIPTLLHNAENIEFSPLYCDLDGRFPNHEANPLKEETLVDLKKKVLETKADIGIATDGDADRCGFVDEKGRFIPADSVGALLIEYYAEQGQRHFCYDLRSTKKIEEIVSSFGGEATKTRVGHSYIKKTMRQKEADFAVELSGHFYFRFGEDFLYDSAIKALIEVLNMLSKEEKTFSELVDKYMTYVKSPETNFHVDDKEKALESLKQAYKDAKLEEIDGITLIGEKWWANIRSSNTENILRLNFEAETQELYDKKFNEIKNFIENLS